jgi:hypothetical protein
MPPLTDFIEQLTCPSHPKYQKRHPWGPRPKLTRDERRELRSFCRNGLAKLGLHLPPHHHVSGL